MSRFDSLTTRVLIGRIVSIRHALRLSRATTSLDHYAVESRRDLLVASGEPDRRRDCHLGTLIRQFQQEPLILAWSRRSARCRQALANPTSARGCGSCGRVRRRSLDRTRVVRLESSGAAWHRRSRGPGHRAASKSCARPSYFPLSDDRFATAPLRQLTIRASEFGIRQEQHHEQPLHRERASRLREDLMAAHGGNRAGPGADVAEHRRAARPPGRRRCCPLSPSGSTLFKGSPSRHTPAESRKLKQFPSNLDPRLSDPRSGLVLGAPVPFDVSSHGESEHE